MLKFRIIGRINVRNDSVIRTVRCEGVRKVGSPVETARRLCEEGIDEIVVIDCVASLYGRNTLQDVIAQMSDDVYCPITVCGGVKSVADVRELLGCGADKIGINTAAVADSSLLEVLAHKFGTSTLVSQIDVKRARDGRLVVMTNGAREYHDLPAADWISEVADHGAGEIFLTNVDREGTGEGVDATVLDCMNGTSIPVVVSGGYRTLSDVITAYQLGASGVAMSQFNYGSSVSQFKEALASFIPLRADEVRS